MLIAAKENQIFHMLFSVVNLLLITISIYLGVSLFYKVFVTHITTIAVPKISVSSKEAATYHNSVAFPLSHYDTIIDRNLFLTKKDFNNVDAIKVETLETTDLELKLWGTVIGSPDNAYAVIEEIKGDKRNKKQVLYQTGDSIQGATIKKILDEKIVLNIEGENQVLEIEKFVSSNKTRDYRSSFYQSTAVPLQQSRTIRRDLIDNAISNISELMTQARFYPHAQGIKISNIKSKSIFRRIGLMDGDIVTGVDGQTIYSVDNGLELYDRLKSASAVSLQFNRRGRDRIINYSIR